MAKKFYSNPLYHPCSILEVAEDEDEAEVEVEPEAVVVTDLETPQDSNAAKANSITLPVVGNF